jgi:hypothetical protein
MFGINDDQNVNQSDQPAKTDAPVPPSPFLDETPAAQPADAPVPAPSEPAAPPAAGNSGDDSLVAIKEQALNNLSPLVGHLDQTPEERFKTTMMLIQAADNSALVKDAYEAANQIQDEKARAQALLDVVNEINYFTQKDK